MSQEKKRIAFAKTIQTKNGPMEKLSIELNQVGAVIPKDGKFYLELDPATCKFFNEYEKDGNKRYFLNFVRNTYVSLNPDEYQGGGASQESGVDLPF